MGIRSGLKLMVLALLCAGCARSLVSLGSPPAPAHLATVASRIEVWQVAGIQALPHPAASIAASAAGDAALAATGGHCGQGQFSVAQSALFEHLAELVRRYPELWRSRPGIGPVRFSERCRGLRVLRGRLAPEDGWAVLGVVDRNGHLTGLRGVAQPSSVGQALVRLGLPAGTDGHSESTDAGDPITSGLLALSGQVEQGYRNQRLVAPALSAPLRRAVARVSPMYPELSAPVQVLELRLAEPDARALPGPTILFHQGLWPYLESLAALDYVLAHELAHLVLDHSRERLVERGEGQADDVLALELAADAEALRRLQKSDLTDGDLERLFDRLALAKRAPPPERIEALNAQLLPAGTSATDPTLHQPALAALDLWLSAGRLDDAAQALAWLPQSIAGRQRFELALRQARTPVEFPLDDPALGAQSDALALRALAALGRGEQVLEQRLWQRWLQGAASPEIRLVEDWIGQGCDGGPAPMTDGRRGFGGLRYTLPGNWSVALQTGDRLILTPDHTELTRIDLWPRGKAPGGDAVPSAWCGRSPLGLWQALAELRRELAPLQLEIMTVLPRTQGWDATVIFSDASAIRWRGLLLRRGRGPEAVTALMRAPEAHFYERALAAASMLVDGPTAGPGR